MKLQEAIKDFYADQAYKGNSPATVKHYRDIFEHYMKDTGVEDLQQFNAPSIRRWLGSHTNLARTTHVTYDRALRVLARWLEQNGYVAENPMKGLPKPKAKRQEIVTFTHDEIRAMLQEAGNPKRKRPKRDYALVLLLLDTGIRIGEAANLKLESIYWTNSSLLVNGKTGERIVPFSSKVKIALKRYIDQERQAPHPQERTLFLTPSKEPWKSSDMTRHVIRLAKAANVQASKLGPHTFRHTFATEYIRAGGDAFSLQKILGHTTTDMVRRYIHMCDADLRTAHKKFSVSRYF